MEDEMEKFQCNVCGFVWDGSAPQEECPKCGAPMSAFEELSAEDAAKVQRSRKTNCLHSKVIALARELEELATEGIEDELDPGCVDVFTKVRNMAWWTMKLSMTEQLGHTKKGKWG